LVARVTGRPGGSTGFDRFFALAGFSPYLDRSSYRVNQSRAGSGLITMLKATFLLQILVLRTYFLFVDFEHIYLFNLSVFGS